LSHQVRVEHLVGYRSNDIPVLDDHALVDPEEVHSGEVAFAADTWVCTATNSPSASRRSAGTAAASAVAAQAMPPVTRHIG
jgi:hypothetical protein